MKNPAALREPPSTAGFGIDLLSTTSSKRELSSVSDPELRDALAQDGTLREGAWVELLRRHGHSVELSITNTLIRYGWSLDRHVIDDLIAATWLRLIHSNCRSLRAWKQGSEGLAAFLARVGRWQTLTWCRRCARRREVHLDDTAMRTLSNTADCFPSPEVSADSKRADSLAQSWQEQLGPWEMDILNLRKSEMTIRDIARTLGEPRMSICRTLLRLESELCQYLGVTKRPVGIAL